MKFGTMESNGGTRGVMLGSDGLVRDLEAVAAKAGLDGVRSAMDIVTAASGGRVLDRLDPDSVPGFDSGGSGWAPPISKPSKILGVAFNNRELMRKAHRDPGVPNFFLKPPSCLTGHRHPIAVDPDWGAVIPEPEVCAVIGRKAKHIREEDALGHVFGFTILNDVTSHGLKFGKDAIAVTYDRDMARPEFYQWRNLRDPDDTDAFYVYHARSKGADTFGPCGPWITTTDEIGDPNNLEIKGSIDGEAFTADHTGSYRFSVEACIAEAARYFTLEPGDLVAFGTAAKGVGRFPRGHKSVLLGETAGTISIEIEKLGRLENPVIHRKGGAG